MYGNKLKYKPSLFLYTVFFIVSFLAFSVLRGQEIRIDWEPREDLNLRLPQSVRIYDGVGELADKAPVKAVYAEIDLTDKNLNIRSIGYNKHRESTLETARKNQALLAINGGYFAADHSVSLIIQDGKLVAPGSVGKKGAFVMENNKPEVVWTTSSEEGVVKKLNALTGEKADTNWHPDQAVGGGPVLIKDGKIALDYVAEGFGKSHDLRHPRTAVGYKNDTTLLFMLVDGRQAASVGVTLEELAQVMQGRGAYEAVNLDGGGSSTMVAHNEVINVPTDISGGNRNSLRQNAGALVISEAIPSAATKVYQFDTEDETYTEFGIWKTADEVNYYGSSPTRKAQVNSNNKGYYHFKNLPGGEYQLSVWNPVNPEKEKRNNVEYVLHGKNGHEQVTINQYGRKNFGRWNVLGSYFITAGDSLEIRGTVGDEIAVDAIRLIPLKKTPKLPVRGDFRFAVISDLNSGLGATDYEWQVDSIVQRIPRFWSPDLILSGGDMVAGMGVSDTVQLRKMWNAFQEDVFHPLTQARTPFAFTLGNHDAHDAHPIEKKFANQFWKGKSEQTHLHFIDKEHFPCYYSFRSGDNFFLSWDASSGKISTENLKWAEQQLQSKEAKTAKNRFVIGHMPLYAVAKERDGKGDLLQHPNQLRQLLEKYDVKAYISGHQHTYYPGKRGKLELLNAGAAGSGPRSLLGENTPETNTITIVDLFYKTGKMVYTTYAIKEKDGVEMTLLSTKEMPSSIFSENGYLIRRDINTSVNAAKGDFRNMESAHLKEAKNGGEATAQVIGKNKIKVSGWFISEERAKSVVKKYNVQLLLNKNTEKGQLIGNFGNLNKKKGKYIFEEEFLVENPGELLAVGALCVSVKTKDGVWQTQLYPKKNKPPGASRITSHQTRNRYGIRNAEALYTFQWEESQDPDGDKVSYRYELAQDSLFEKPLLTHYTGRKNELKVKESDLYKLVGNDSVGKPQRFYHRVASSDGSHLTFSTPLPLYLQKSNQKIKGPMEVEPPNYQLAQHIATGAKGYGATWDKNGNLWLADYYKGLIILDKDLKPVENSPLKEVQWKGKPLKLSPVTGLSRDRDGNILAAINRKLVKVDSDSKVPIAVWEVPGENRAITTPQVSDLGEIYLMSLFPEDDNYVIKQDSLHSDSFQLLRKIELPNRNLSRAFAMSSDASMLYLPDPGIGKIQVYSSEDGRNYKQQPSLSTENGGSSAVQVLSDKGLMMATRTNGISPSGFRYINPDKQQVWSLELPELKGAEPRGISVSEDLKTLIFCSWDKAGGYYIFQLKNKNP